MRYTLIPVATLDRLSGLSLDAKAIYLILLTGPHRTSAPGLFRAGRPQLIETAETTPEIFTAAIDVLTERGLVLADFAQRVVFLPHAVEDDPPDSGKVVSSWRTVLDELPLCPVKIEAWRTLRKAASAARDRAEARPRRKGEELAPVRWEAELGPEPGTDTPSDTPPDTLSDTPSDRVSTDRVSTDTQNTPTPNPTPTQRQNQSPRGMRPVSDFSSHSRGVTGNPKIHAFHEVDDSPEGAAARAACETCQRRAGKGPS
jgi:hypothetical protein